MTVLTASPTASPAVAPTADLPLKPVVSIGAIHRVLMRHAQGTEPEKALGVAVLTLAIADCRGGLRLSPPPPTRTRLSQHQAQIRRRRLEAGVFMHGEGLRAWAGLLGLNASFVRDLAIKTGYLQPCDAKDLAILQQELAGWSRAYRERWKGGSDAGLQ
jgi:hypothetical protein